jgi:hypothetical protein
VGFLAAWQSGKSVRRKGGFDLQAVAGKVLLACHFLVLEVAVKRDLRAGESAKINGRKGKQ